MKLHREIVLAFIVILLITALYLGVVTYPERPVPGDSAGHVLGILGFLLILATETLYSIRKRSPRLRWGRLQTWLQFHIFTGIVGPFMVFLHTSFEFHGLAGIVALGMGIVVFSGFVGRYIYMAVPRTSEGTLVAREDLELERINAEKELQKQLPVEASFIFQPLDGISGGIGTVLNRVFLRWRTNAAWRRRLQNVDSTTREKMLQVEPLRKRRNELLIQIRSYEIAPRLLSLWRSVHIPLGISLFVAALVHIGAALYYVIPIR